MCQLLISCINPSLKELIKIGESLQSLRDLLKSQMMAKRNYTIFLEKRLKVWKNYKITKRMQK
jgi:hypothetical protein